ncbi:MAG: PIN domain-containing protein [Candidatus Xenobia bacterium]
MSYLIDTNVISELRKPACEASVLAWFKTVQSAHLFLSVLVVGEIRSGIERLRRRNDAPQAELYETWLARLRHDHAERILPITSDIAEVWGRMNVPHRVPVVDGLMAATAEVHGLTFVTRNVADLATTGVSLLNPFQQ